jgi:hypothetical protein
VDPRVGRPVHKVKFVGIWGHLGLERYGKKTIKDSVENAAPLYLPNIDILQNQSWRGRT